MSTKEARRRVDVWFCAADAVVGCTAAGFYFCGWVIGKEPAHLGLAAGFFFAGVLGAVLCVRRGLG